MESDMAKEMLKDFSRSSLEQIERGARHRARLLRDCFIETPFVSDDARRFDALANAIGALWPRMDVV